MEKKMSCAEEGRAGQEETWQNQGGGRRDCDRSGQPPEVARAETGPCAGAQRPVDEISVFE